MILQDRFTLEITEEIVKELNLKITKPKDFEKGVTITTKDPLELEYDLNKKILKTHKLKTTWFARSYDEPSKTITIGENKRILLKPKDLERLGITPGRYNIRLIITDKEDKAITSQGFNLEIIRKEIGVIKYRLYLKSERKPVELMELGDEGVYKITTPITLNQHYWFELYDAKSGTLVSRVKLEWSGGISRFKKLATYDFRFDTPGEKGIKLRIKEKREKWKTYIFRMNIEEKPLEEFKEPKFKLIILRRDTLPLATLDLKEEGIYEFPNLQPKIIYSLQVTEEKGRENEFKIKWSGPLTWGIEKELYKIYLMKPGEETAKLKITSKIKKEWKREYTFKIKFGKEKPPEEIPSDFKITIIEPKAKRIIRRLNEPLVLKAKTNYPDLVKDYFWDITEKETNKTVNRIRSQEIIKTPFELGLKENIDYTIFLHPIDKTRKRIKIEEEYVFDFFVLRVEPPEVQPKPMPPIPPEPIPVPPNTNLPVKVPKEFVPTTPFRIVWTLVPLDPETKKALPKKAISLGTTKKPEAIVKLDPKLPYTNYFLTGTITDALTRKPITEFIVPLQLKGRPLPKGLLPEPVTIGKPSLELVPAGKVQSQIIIPSGTSKEVRITEKIPAGAFMVWRLIPLDPETKKPLPEETKHLGITKEPKIRVVIGPSPYPHYWLAALLVDKEKKPILDKEEKPIAFLIPITTRALKEKPERLLKPRKPLPKDAMLFITQPKEKNITADQGDILTLRSQTDYPEIIKNYPPVWYAYDKKGEITALGEGEKITLNTTELEPGAYKIETQLLDKDERLISSDNINLIIIPKIPAAPKFRINIIDRATKKALPFPIAYKEGDSFTYNIPSLNITKKYDLLLTEDKKREKEFNINWVFFKDKEGYTLKENNRLPLRPTEEGEWKAVLRIKEKAREKPAKYFFRIKFTTEKREPIILREPIKVKTGEAIVKERPIPRKLEKGVDISKLLRQIKYKEEELPKIQEAYILLDLMQEIYRSWVINKWTKKDKQGNILKVDKGKIKRELVHTNIFVNEFLPYMSLNPLYKTIEDLDLSENQARILREFTGKYKIISNKPHEIAKALNLTRNQLRGIVNYILTTYFEMFGLKPRERLTKIIEEKARV